MNARPFRALSWCSVMVLAGVSVCSAEQPATPAPVVPVALPVERLVTDYQDFTGRTGAVQQVEIRARVSGFLVNVPFKDGTEVKQGDLLFEVDTRPYQLRVDQAASRLALDEASLKLAKAVYDRDRARAAAVAGSISAQQLDQDMAAVEEATARVRSSRAGMDECKLNLSFTRVTAPIDGRIGRRLLDVGNLVQADSTILATVVSEDPIYAYFDVDERTLLHLRRAINEGRLKANSEWMVHIGLTGEEGFPRRARVDFTDNCVNAETGTVRLRAVLANPRPPDGVRLLSPGMFVRVRMPIGAPYKALLVIDRAVGSDQGLKYVYVIDGENKVQYRRVRTGPLQDDGLRAISAGLKPDDLVIVGGLRDLRPNLTVRPEKVVMPALAMPSNSGEKGP
jgi:membrane fusion protein, multidrug efflux system